MAATAAEPQPQYMVALERANQARLARASIKRHIRNTESIEESRDRAVEVVLTSPDAARGWEVHALLCTIRRLGAGRASKICGKLQLRETKPLGDLTERQRNELAGHLRANVPTRAKPPALFEDLVA